MNKETYEIYTTEFQLNLEEQVVTKENFMLYVTYSPIEGLVVGALIFKRPSRKEMKAW